MAYGSTLFVAFAIALSLLPAMMTVMALVWWWRSLQHRALFAMTALLALLGMESLIHHWVIGVAAVLPTDTRLVDTATGGASESDQILALVESANLNRLILALLLLLAGGVGYLAWLRRA